MRGDAGAEEWVMVLATGPPPATAGDRPLVQGLGVTTFPLLEVAVTDASELGWGDRLYIGPGTWDRVQRIERRLTPEELAPAVQSTLWPTVETLIRRNEARYIEYFNTTMLNDFDRHPLALLPDLAPDCRDAIIAARRQGRFVDFADLIARVECLDRPRELLVKRVLVELQAGDDTYHWLTECRQVDHW